MAFDYLYYVNRLCTKLNEVELDSSNFASADGVYQDFKNAINAAILDIYQEEDNEWPFGWNTATFTTTIGQSEYTKHVDADSIDWDSFAIIRAAISVDSITQSSGTATVTVSAGHQLVTGDNVYIKGADQSGYNGTFIATVSSDTVFTIQVDASTVTPATGTITLYPDYSSKKLTWINVDTYRKEGRYERDLEAFEDDEYCKPEVVVRKHDNNFIISPKPDRVYTITYDYFSMPDDLELWSDTPSIPDRFKDVIVNGAMYHGYFFRDNLEQTAMIERKYKDDVNRMRRILIPQSAYMRAE